MVFAIQCPNPKCRKFMLVEDKDRNSAVNCLICNVTIKLGTSQQKAAETAEKKPPEKPAR